MSTPRFDPTGKRALFETPVSAPDEVVRPGHVSEGRHALFSTGAPRPGTVIIECSTCAARSRATLADVGFRMATGSVWFPARKHSHWMRCPACGTRTWCRIGWRE